MLFYSKYYLVPIPWIKKDVKKYQISKKSFKLVKDFNIFSTFFKKYGGLFPFSHCGMNLNIQNTFKI